MADNRSELLPSDAAAALEPRWVVLRQVQAWEQMHRMFSGLRQSALAHAVTLQGVRAVAGLFPLDPPRSGQVLDLEYEAADGHTSLFTLRLDGSCFDGEALAIGFAIRPDRNLAPHRGKIGVLDACWWSRRAEPQRMLRLRKRHRQFVRQSESASNEGKRT